MAKQGFKGQWVAISRVGKFFDDRGVERDLNADFLRNVVANYSAPEHEAPAVIGHPKDDNPAFGWVAAVRLNDADELEAQFSDTDDTFEQLVEQGRFKKISTAFYLESPKGSSVKAPTIKHVGFLGAATPAVKGLRQIQFAEGESFALEQSFNLQEKNMGLEDKDVEKVTDSVFEKLKNLFKPDGSSKAADPEAANFSEQQITDLIKTATDTAKTELTAAFTEKLEAKNKELEDLQKKVDAGLDGGRRAEIAQFVESIPGEKGKHFLKNIGIGNFLESLAEADAKDEKKAISFSEGSGDDKVDHEFSRLEFAKNLINSLPPMIQFGEKFGNLVATKEVDAMVNPGRVAEMKKAAGIKSDGGAK